MKYKENWEDTKNKFTNWWKSQNEGRPLMCVIARKNEIVPLPDEYRSHDTFQKYRDPEHMIRRYRHFCENHLFLGESFPNMSADFGPGSLAAYIGSDIKFDMDTVWFEPCIKDNWTEISPIVFDPENKWWKEHYSLIKKCRELAGDDFYIGIPDLMENVDVLASMRSAEPLIFDMLDDPEEMEARVRQIDDIYFEYFDRFYDLVKDKENGSCYTVFQIWGSGRTAKLQCDFSALLSPNNFRDFVQESLRRQAKKMDHVLYHLDGPDAIKHVDALMEIDEIDALQWTSGDYGPDGTLEKWDAIYDKVRKAGKSLWIKVYDGGLEDWIKGVDRLVKKYGSAGLFFFFPVMSESEAKILLDYAEKNWSSVRGEFER